jgi:hypothetical protein
VLVEFDQCSRMHAFVRWSRDGRMGINFGHELVLAASPGFRSPSAPSARCRRPSA